MTNDRLKMIFGFVLLIGLLILAGAIALGKVTEQTSFGLQGIINGLFGLTGAFAGWAFGSAGKNENGGSPR